MAQMESHAQRRRVAQIERHGIAAVAIAYNEDNSTVFCGTRPIKLKMTARVARLSNRSNTH